MVKSRPATGRFGVGRLPYVPSAVRMPFTQADLDRAAQAFNDDATGPEPDRDARAAQRF